MFLAGAFHLFVLAYEEPTLRGTHGAEYVADSRAVRRWISRLSAYRGEPASPGAGGR